MRIVSLLLGLMILVGGAATSAAQEAAPSSEVSPPTKMRTLAEVRAEAAAKRASEQSVVGIVIDQLTRNLSWVPGVLLFLAALIKGDRGAWWFAFLAGVATLVIFGASTLFRELGPWLSDPIGTIIGTAVVLVLTFGLFILHQKRLDIFARTEITFGVVGIGYSLHTIQQPGVWAALIVSVYGLVEGFTRMREADGRDSLLAAFDGPTSDR